MAGQTAPVREPQRRRANEEAVSFSRTGGHSLFMGDVIDQQNGRTADTAIEAADYTEDARRLLRAILPRVNSLSYRDQRFIEGWQSQLTGNAGRIGICRFASLSELAAKLGLIAPELAAERADSCRAIVGQGVEG